VSIVLSDKLLNKRICITGAAAGIGLGIAKACANAGASLVLTDIDYDRLVAVAQELDLEPNRITTIQLDVSSSDDIKHFFKSLEDNNETLNGVVNNAGITVVKDFLSFPESDLERLWKTNLRSTFIVCQQVGKLMSQQKGGSIVNVSSNHARASIPGYEMYTATKAGIIGMTRAMSWSLGQHGIRVNTLSPGLTQTEAIAKLVAERPEFQQKFNDIHATGRYATVTEIGNVAVFLLSDDAASITGADLVADHGLSSLLCPKDEIE